MIFPSLLPCVFELTFGQSAPLIYYNRGVKEKYNLKQVIHSMEPDADILPHGVGSFPFVTDTVPQRRGAISLTDEEATTVRTFLANQFDDPDMEMSGTAYYFSMLVSSPFLFLSSSIPIESLFLFLTSWYLFCWALLNIYYFPPFFYHRLSGVKRRSDSRTPFRISWS